MSEIKKRQSFTDQMRLDFRMLFSQQCRKYGYVGPENITRSCRFYEGLSSPNRKVFWQAFNDLGVQKAKKHYQYCFKAAMYPNSDKILNPKKDAIDDCIYQIVKKQRRNPLLKKECLNRVRALFPKNELDSIFPSALESYVYQQTQRFLNGQYERRERSSTRAKRQQQETTEESLIKETTQLIVAYDLLSKQEDAQKPTFQNPKEIELPMGDMTLENMNYQQYQVISKLDSIRKEADDIILYISQNPHCEESTY